jgi:hypothetical protein
VPHEGDEAVADNEEPAYFVTNDNRMRDGVLDPDDIAIVKDMIIITAEEALRLAEEENADEANEVAQERAEDEPLPSDAIRLTPEQMDEMAKHAGEALKAFEVIAEAIVTRLEMGSFVRAQRIEERKSWRAVSRSVHEEVQRARKLTSPLWEPVSNQLMGMTLCKVAAEVADQDYMEPPWN